MKRGFFNKHITLVAATTLIGTIVGAGILGIPYVLAKAGFLYGLLLIVAMGIAFMFLNLFTGEVVLRTKKQHQLTGYAEKYLGKWGKGFMGLAMFVATYGALTAYLIGEGATLYSIFKWGSPLLYTLIFFAITFVIIYKGVKATGKTEFILISLLILIVVLIGVLSPQKNFLNNFSIFNPAFFFLPYGVILFAFMGSPAVPELQEVLGKNKKLMKRAIIIGSITPIILYVVFSLIIGSIIGVEQFDALAPNDRIATIALQIYSQPILGIFANLLAVLAMFTSFLTLGIALIEVYHYDYKLNYYLSLFLTFSLPLVIVLLDLTNFLAVLGVSGAFAGGLEGILIILMYWKAKIKGDRKPEYKLGKNFLLGTILIVMFALGIIYQLWQNFFLN
tara:strand:+ start:105941 stop:107113 length:1173 start_codon:yes stop_codon:yes gene_type:complete